jgi:hypothetical protein
MPKETFFLKKLLDYGYDYINHISVSLFLFIILTVLGLSCNTEKQIAKKDNAALERVKAKNTLLNAAGNEWVKNHPCVEPTIKPGKPDTITETYIDTAAIQQLQAENDSLFSLIKI